MLTYLVDFVFPTPTGVFALPNDVFALPTAAQQSLIQAPLRQRRADLYTRHNNHL